MEASLFEIHPVGFDEPLARFLTSKEHFRTSDGGRVHHSAFKLPNGMNNISVYRTKDMSTQEIWNLAHNEVTMRRIDHAEVLAMARISVREVETIRLRIDPNGVPHPRHANIENWPIQKEDLLERRQALANAAVLSIK